MRRLHRPAHRPSYIIAICLALIVGIWAGMHGMIVAETSTFVVAGCVLLLWRSALWWITLVVLAGVCGVLRADHYAADLSRLTDRIGTPVTISATVVTDPVTDERHRTQVRLGLLRLDGRPVVGIIKLSGRNLRLERSFQIVAYGRLKPGFATWDGELDYPRLTVTNDRLPPLERLRQAFFGGMRTAVPDPESSFGLGLLVGVGALIPKYLQLELTRVGLSHLTAVSGYNLTIIIRLVMRLLGRLGPNVVMVLSLWLIAVFVVIAGASASIVRAGAIAALSLVAHRSGLRIAPTVLIAVTAAATLLYNPAYLHDAGWALSFLAFFGILVVAPAVMERYGEPSWALGRMLIETLAAEVMTLPYIMVVFHQMSLIGLVANILIEPVIPLAMALAASAAVCGMVMPSLAGPIGFVTQQVLQLILELVATLASLPWASIELRMAMAAAVGWYLVLVGIVWHIAQRSARQAQFDILCSDRSTQCLDTQNGPP